jgi:Rod binding domain-containing protein
MVEATAPLALNAHLALNAPSPSHDMRRIVRAAKDFEAVFIAQMLEPLFASIKTPEIAGGGKSEDFFKSMMQEAYAKAMAERGGFGIADHVKAKLIDLQGARDAALPPQETRS